MLILWEGESRLDGKPIVAIATPKSKNDKTGSMVQTWFMRSDISPWAAVNSGADESVCGDCPFRGIVVENEKHGTTNRNRGCYVNIANAPMAIWKAYKAGKYVQFDREQHSELFKNRKLRFGAYGEAVAVPMRVFQPLVKLVRGWTGYTHQWRDRRFSAWKKYLMASVESVCDAQQAWGKGWRTYRVTEENGSTLENETVCLHTSSNIQCADCMLCDGTGKGKKGSIVQHATGGNRKKSALAVVQLGMIN